MKSRMIGHVTSHRGAMFRNATNHVQRQLEELCVRIGQDLEANVQDLRARLARDYLAVLVGVDVSSVGMGPSRVELMLRGEMAPLLAEADGVFAELFVDAEHAGEGEVVGGQKAEDEEDEDELVKSQLEATARESVWVKAEAEE
jgi:hypothetical protein